MDSNNFVLLERKFGTVILDEAHKARRRGGLGEKKDEPNNLLEFMLRIGSRTKNLLLSTATPIQTDVSELWDLMRILNAGADFVLGREALSNWANWQKALPIVKGDTIPQDERDAWEWLRNPLPRPRESRLVNLGWRDARHVGVNAKQLRWRLHAHQIDNDCAPVAALRNKFRGSEALHLRDPGACDATGAPPGHGRFA
jgi:hypothetical protein